MEFDYIAFILFLVYLVLFGLESKQLIDIFFLKNKKITYRNGIIAILWVSAVFRVFIWCKTMSPSVWPAMFLMVVYYLPVWFNFAALSLLTIFYAIAYMEDGSGNNSSGNRALLAWRIGVSVNMVFLVLNVAIACLLEDTATDKKDGEVFYTVYIVYAVFIDALAAVLIGYFGAAFVAKNLANRHWVLPRPVGQFAVVNWTITAAFLLRSILVLVLSTNALDQRDNATLKFNGSHNPTSITILVFYLVTEATPNAAMVYLLWKARYRETRKHRQISQGSSLSVEEDMSDSEIVRPSDPLMDNSEDNLRDLLLERQTSRADAEIRVIYNTHSTSTSRQQSQDVGLGLGLDYDADYDLGHHANNNQGLLQWFMGGRRLTGSGSGYSMATDHHQKEREVRQAVIDSHNQQHVTISGLYNSSRHSHKDLQSLSTHLDPRDIFSMAPQAVTADGDYLPALDDPYAETVGPSDILRQATATNNH